MATQVNKVAFNVMLPPDLHGDLAELAAKRDTNIATLMRAACRAYVRMEKKEEPTCANETPCLCPAKWGRQHVGPAQRVSA